MRPAVSAIIVNYNAGLLLRNCVDSLLECSQAVEIIVVDNASTDSSLDALDGLPNLVIKRNTENLGFASACNTGMHIATSAFMLFLNPDCKLEQGALTELLNATVEDDRVGMVGGLIVNPDGTEQAGGRRAVPTPWRSFVRAFGLYRLSNRWPRLFDDFYLHELPLPKKAVEIEAISGACMMVKREAVDSVGVWDEGYFLHCEDLDWCMRFRIKGWKIIFVPSARVTHVHGACSKGRPLFVEWHKHKGMIRFYRKFFKHQYPFGLMLLVELGVWVRFSLVSMFKLIGLGRARLATTKTLSE